MKQQWLVTVQCASYCVYPYLILRRALRPLLRVWIVLGAEAVHELVDEVEHAHAQRDPLLLAALQRDEQRVEAVRVLVGPAWAVTSTVCCFN